MVKYGGWTGKVLRVDLTSGKISTEDTIAKYKDFLGGTGIGFKVMWDEVPPSVGPWDPENRIIFGVGPLTGSGALSSARTQVISRNPICYPDQLPDAGHMGGAWGPELKYAGYDSLIIQGKADHPVWLSIVDDEVDIEDASMLWGNGLYRAQTEIIQRLGGGEVAAIGQAGENLVRLSNIMTGLSHSAGLVGSVMGSKNLKAVGVKGSGSVKIAADPKDFEDFLKYHYSIVSAGYGAVVPMVPQDWSPWSSSSSRWYSQDGQFWGAADPPVRTGVCRPEEMHKIGYRQTKFSDWGAIPADQWACVRMGGCQSCPVPCHTMIRVPEVKAKYGLPEYGANSCVAAFPSIVRTPSTNTYLRMRDRFVAKALLDDYGICNDYQGWFASLLWLYQQGVIKANVPAAEYNAVPWNMYDPAANFDPAWLIEFLRRIAFKEGVMGRVIGEGSGFIKDYWKMPDVTPNYEYATRQWKFGLIGHHTHTDSYQPGVLNNMLYNRDGQCHEFVAYNSCGLPLAQKKSVFEALFGPGFGAAVDEFATGITPMNIYKAKWAKWGLGRRELHNSLTLCDSYAVYPGYASALKERNYVGDTSLESKYYSLVTGDTKSESELDLVGWRLLTFYRALNIKYMNTNAMRTKHDIVPDWVFDGTKPFTPGSSTMDRADIETAKDMFYGELGWDRSTGAPTRATYTLLGLSSVADELTRLGLTPP